jgi:hypothetical protein
MHFRHPAAVIDSVIADLGYLTEFLLDEIDHTGANPDQPSPGAVKAIAALEGTRLLLPRLRVVRSNFVADARLPGMEGTRELFGDESSESGRDAGETPPADKNVGVVR